MVKVETSLRRVLFFLLLSFMMHPLLAQEHRLEGLVVEAGNGKPIGNVYIELFSKGDTIKPLAVSVSDADGHFLFEEPRHAVSLLVFRHLGYEEFRLESVEEQPLLVEMQPRATELGGVEIVAGRQAKLKLSTTGFSYSPTEGQTKLENIYEYIKELPFVSSNEGSFSISGRGKALVYLNHRQLYDLSELKLLMMAELLSVDVITSPGGEYPADTRAVILIKTKRKKEQALGGTLRLGADYQNKLQRWGDLSLLFTSPKWSLRGSFEYDHSPTSVDIEMEQEVKGTDPFKVNYRSMEEPDNRYLKGTASFVYEPNQRHSLGGRYHYTRSKVDDDVHHLLSIQEGSRLDMREDIYQTHMTYNRHFANAYYAFSSEYWTFRGNLDYASGQNQTRREYKMVDHSHNDVESHHEQRDKLLNLEAQSSYKRAGWRFTLGGSFAKTSVEQLYNIAGAIGLNSSAISLDQDRYAAFLNGSYNLEHGMLRAGLRYEAIRLGSKDLTSGKREQLLSRGRLYPSISIAYQLGYWQLQGAFEVSTKYPSYNQLRSEVNFSSPYLYEAGNPRLLPSIFYEASLRARYKKLTLYTAYTKQEDAILGLISLYEPRIMLSQDINTPHSWSINLGAAYSWQWRSLEGKLDASYGYSDYRLPLYHDKGGMLRLKSNTSWQLSSYLQPFLDLSYTSRTIADLFEIEPTAWLALGVRGALLKDKIRYYISLYDPFLWQRKDRSFSTKELAIRHALRQKTRGVYLSLTYSFEGLTKQKDYQGNTSNQELNRL